jgi:GT2 family glycosyltransferase
VKLNPRICVVVAVRNRKEYTKRFLISFIKSTYTNYEIVIIDDGSTDGTDEFLRKDFKKVTLFKGNGELWWAGCTNLGVKYAIKNNFDYVLTINNDAIVSKDYLRTMVKCCLKKPNALIGSLITRSDTKRIWSIGGYLDWTSNHLFNLRDHNSKLSLLKTLQNPYPAEILNGDGTLIPTKIFEKIGIYNAFFTPQYHADSEIVLRAAKYGYKAYVCLNAVLINEISTTPLVQGFKQLIFRKKSDYYWKALLYFYIMYCPIKYKLNIIKQYTKFLTGNRYYAFISRIYKRLFTN